MATPFNQSVADSALLTKSLPLGLLRAFVQSDAADEGLTPQLLAELKILARVPGLLVACNYGGTLCDAEGISTETLPLGSAAIALRALAALPNTHAAVISGRSLRDLAAVSRLPAEVHLVGSHGAEFGHGLRPRACPWPPNQCSRRSARRCRSRGRLPGHQDRAQARGRVRAHPAGRAGRRRTGRDQTAREIARAHGLFFIVDGSVLDLSVVEPSKADALENLRSMLGASAALYAGDASSDELAIATLRGPDMGLRVGRGIPAPHTGCGTRSRSPGSWPSSSNCGGPGCSARTPSAWNGTP